MGCSIHQQHTKKKDQIEHRKHEQATSRPPFLVVAPTYLPCEKNHDRSKHRRSRAIDGSREPQCTGYQPDAAHLLAGIRAAISDSRFLPPIDVTDLLRAPAISSNSWMVCIRGTPPAGPQGWTYSAFFKEKYVQSRYSADNDGCGGQQFHPFLDPATISPPSPAAAPVAKKHHRTPAK